MEGKGQHAAAEMYALFDLEKARALPFQLYDFQLRLRAPTCATTDVTTKAGMSHNTRRAQARLTNARSPRQRNIDARLIEINGCVSHLGSCHVA